MNIISQQITMSKSRPTRPILRIQSTHPFIILNSSLIISFSSTKLSKFTQIMKRHQHRIILLLSQLRLSRNITILSRCNCANRSVSLIAIVVLIVSISLIRINLCLLSPISIIRPRHLLLLLLLLLGHLLTCMLCLMSKKLLHEHMVIWLFS